MIIECTLEIIRFLCFWFRRKLTFYKKKNCQRVTYLLAINFMLVSPPHSMKCSSKSFRKWIIVQYIKKPIEIGEGALKTPNNSRESQLQRVIYNKKAINLEKWSMIVVKDLKYGESNTPWALWKQNSISVLDIFQTRHVCNICSKVCPKPGLLVIWNLMMAKSCRLIIRRSFLSSLQVIHINSLTKYMGLQHFWKDVCSQG